MTNYFDKNTGNGCYLGLRFLGVSLVTMFGLLAIGADVIDVFAAYFNTGVSPEEAIIWVGLFYYFIISFLLLSNIFPEPVEDLVRQFGWRGILLMAFVVLIGPIILAFIAVEVFHPLPVNYPPGELESWRVILLTFTGGVIVIESLVTAYYDLRRQRSKS